MQWEIKDSRGVVIGHLPWKTSLTKTDLIDFIPIGAVHAYKLEFVEESGEYELIPWSGEAAYFIVTPSEGDIAQAARELEADYYDLLNQERLEDDINELAQYERNLRQAIKPMEAYIKEWQIKLRRLVREAESVERKRLQLEKQKKPAIKIETRGRKPKSLSLEQQIASMSREQLLQIKQALEG